MDFKVLPMVLIIIPKIINIIKILKPTLILNTITIM